MLNRILPGFMTENGWKDSMFDNVELDLLKSGLMVMIRDKYAMPSTFPEFNSKYQKVAELYQKLEQQSGAIEMYNKNITSRH